MKTLPQGVTGFDSPRHARPWRDIRKPIVQAVYRCNASIKGEFPCDTKVTPNYHFVKTSAVSILIHEAFPLMAFTEATDVPYLEIEFCEWLDFSQLFSKTDDWQVLPMEFLNHQITPQVTEALSPTEQDQIRYWKPAKIGDVIFNNWD